MMILGVDFTEMAKPATLKTMETDLGTEFRLTYRGLAYHYILSHFELVYLSSNDLIIQHITNIINDGKHQLGIKDTCSEYTPRI